MKPIITGLIVLAWLGTFNAPVAAEGEGSADGASVLRRFEAELDRRDSATQALTRWCADHRMADPPRIVAVRVRGVDKAADGATRRLLGAGRNEPLRYRRVRLTCGTHVLSEADNWYRPNLLTPEMNERLDSGDTPFGVVVGPLDFHRKTLDVRWLFHPRARSEAAMPHDVLRHRALLLNAQGVAFSLVVETYTSEIMAFGASSGAGPTGKDVSR
jgi:hypothetical protein